VVVLVLLGVLAVAALSIGLYLVNQTPSVRVPDLSGRTVAQADADLAALGLRGDAHPKKQDGCTSGQVIGQNPKFGKVVDKGSQVDYDVCAEPNQVAVPPLIGLSVDDAEQSVRQNGLVPQTETIDAVEKDKVVSTTPAANTLLNPGDTVVLKVGNGKLALLPDLTGQTRDGAAKALRDAGFTANPRFVNRTVTNPDDDGKVVSTDQKAGQPYKKTTQITIFIGKVDQQPSPDPSVNSPSPSTGAG
jgi:eukaryotic-like serine/threonine-protein kinase